MRSQFLITVNCIIYVIFCIFFLLTSNNHEFSLSFSLCNQHMQKKCHGVLMIKGENTFFLPLHEPTRLIYWMQQSRGDLVISKMKVLIGLQVDFSSWNILDLHPHKYLLVKLFIERGGIFEAAMGLYWSAQSMFSWKELLQNTLFSWLALRGREKKYSTQNYLCV